MSAAHPLFTRTNTPLPPPVNNVFKVKVVSSLEGQNCNSTFWYRDSNAIGTATLPQLGAFLNKFNGPLVSDMVSKYTAACSADLSVTSIQGEITTSPQLVGIYISVGRAGLSLDKPLPSTVGVTIQRYTGFKGQCGRGRITMPGVPVTWATRSILTDTLHHDELATAMLGAITVGADTYTPGLYSRGPAKNPRAGWADLSATFRVGTLGSAQTRKIGVGK